MREDIVKITHAVYAVLDFLPQGDPLKNKAKEKALAILENFTLVGDENGWLSLKKYLASDRENVIIQALHDVDVLEGYLEIAKHQGWISNVNFLIIIKEYGKIKEYLTSQRKAVQASATLPQAPAKPEIPKIANEEAFKPENVLRVNEVASGKSSVRQVKILQILAQKQKAQVSDIIKELPDVTKRTIRRDLDELLKAGKIERIGEWNQVFYKILNGTNHLS